MHYVLLSYGYISLLFTISYQEKLCFIQIFLKEQKK